MKHMKYYLSLSFAGNWEQTEEEVENLLGPAPGSGSGFGERDLSYYFKTENSLKAAVKKIRNMPRRIRCRAHKYVDDDNIKEVSLRGVR